MTSTAHELSYVNEIAAVARPAVDPWPVLRVRADDGVDELMFLHEGRRFDVRPQLRGCVLIIPTLDAPASDYVELASRLAELGLNVARAELRGQGHSDVELGADSGYLELVERAIPAMCVALRRRWSQLPIFVLGHGAGGQLACLAAAGARLGIEGLILVGASGADPIRERIGKLGRALLSSGQPRARLRDWARAGRRLCGSDRDWNHALARVRLPVLAIVLANDRANPRVAVEALLERMPRARCQQVEIAGRDATHRGWLGEPGGVVGQIERWQRKPRNRTGPNVCIARELLPRAAGFTAI
jgi:predicted alpha/beta hydrolase